MRTPPLLPQCHQLQPQLLQQQLQLPPLLPLLLHIPQPLRLSPLSPARPRQKSSRAPSPPPLPPLLQLLLRLLRRPP